MVRLSGPDVAAILERVCDRKGRGLPPPRHAALTRFRDAQGAFDEGVLLWMPGPRSYTGEDSAELSPHGNPYLVDRLVEACVAAGAHRAEPGEFTRRAFLHGRLDLTRAEAVLQSIEASTPAGLEVARRGRAGEIQRWVDTVRLDLCAVAAEVEVRLDFAEEHLDLEEDGAVLARVDDLAARLSDAAREAHRGHVLVHGARVALVGPVNAGKSSLFNALCGRRRALVSDVPGTTRDVIEARVDVSGIPVTLLDTAGERATEDPLEAQGMELREDLTADVDLRVVVLPAHLPHLAESLALIERTHGTPRILVGNHADRPGAVGVLGGHPLLRTSAPEGRGLDALRAAIARALVGEAPVAVGIAASTARQRDLFRRVAAHLQAAAAAWRGPDGIVVAATELTAGIEALDEVVGRNAREDVLDALFSRFCVGK